MMLVHNHPSGMLEPSKEDTILTDRMLKLTALLGITLVDQVIVGGDNSRYFSFKEKEMLTMPQINLTQNYQYLEFENRALFIKKYPSSLSDHFLNEITSLPIHSITSIDVVPIPKDMTTKILQKKYLGIESDIIKQQRVRNKNNDFSSEISYNKRIEKKRLRR